MIALVDADLVAFRCAATVPEHEDVEVAFYRVDVLMQQILDASESTSFFAYLTGRNNFRKKINPEYKANRKDKEPPVYLQDCRKWLCDKWQAEISEGCEADDLLAINQGRDTILCSLDKDLDMIPGMHYNWTKNIIYEINKQDGVRHFWKQMLIGDVSDNIQGIHGIGPKKADKLIEHLDEEQEMFETVYNMYNDPKRFVMNANCLWIQRNPGELWQDQHTLDLPSDCQQEVDTTSDFMKSLKADT